MKVRRSLSALIVILVITMLFTGCGEQAKQPGKQATSSSKQQEQSKQIEQTIDEVITFTDSCGRKVEIPKQLTRVAPSGAVSQMIIYTIAPEKLACWAGKLGAMQEAYIDDKYKELPVTGHLYGKGDLNAEALIQANPQVIIDIGDKKDGLEKDLDNITEQTGIPTIFIEGTVETYPQMFRTLGSLLGQEEQGEKLAAYTEATYSQAEAARKQLGDADKLRVMFGTGETGLDCNAKGSIHCGVLEAVGVDNAIEVMKLSNKGGGNTVTMEEVIKADPDVILLDAGGPYSTLKEDPYWSALTAVKEDRYYEIPCGPYPYLANPPSINQIIGIKWLGNLLYPKLYTYDMVSELQDFYNLFWHYDLTQEEAEDLLQNGSTNQ